MTTITVLSGQSMFDIALMTCGIAEAAYDIAMANGVSITGTGNVEINSLTVPESIEKNKRVVEYYAINSLSPATDFETKNAGAPGEINVVEDAGDTGVAGDEEAIVE